MDIKKIVERNFSFFVGFPALIWQVLFFYCPLTFVIGSSFRTLSFEYFTPFFSYIYLLVIVRTLIMASATTMLCLLIGYPVAYWIAFYGRRWKDLLLFFLFVPFWTNFLLHIYAWMFVLDYGGVINCLLLKLGIISEPLHLLHSFFSMGLIMVYCYLPFMILPIYTALEKFDRNLFQASLDLGATWWQTMRLIVFPMSWPAIRSGIFLVFVPAFGEFAIPELVGGDKLAFVGSIVAHYTLSAQMVPLGSAFTLIASLSLMVFIGIIAGLKYFLFSRDYYGK